MQPGHDDAREEPNGPRPDRRHPHRLPDTTYLADPGPVLVTVCVKDDLPLLQGATADAAIAVLLERAANASFLVHAYCTMPTHLHFVAMANGRTPLPDFMRSLKSGASHAINRLEMLRQRFAWQRSYFDTHARDGREARNQIRYVLANPVEAGLCDRWDEWPYSAHLATPL